ncbi:MAG TPA: hypothetical protein VNG51_08590 [Ktedonobacteraceae bacterium]|nr:hypothetical protein [Ktedonobacteraceae bacterium]
MPGRQGQDNEPWDKSSSQRLAAFNGNGTGKQRAVPQRPSNMARMDRPPNTPRIARPQREATKQRRVRRRLLIWSFVFIICALLACGIGYAAVNFFAAINASQGSANTVTDFLSNLQSQNYNAAFSDLAPTLTYQTTPQQFTQQAQNDDRCYGQVTDYSEVANSATTSTDGKTQSFIYNITRTLNGKAKTYQMHISLQKEINTGNWKISSYGNGGNDSGVPNDLGPGQPPCS